MSMSFLLCWFAVIFRFFSFCSNSAVALPKPLQSGTASLCQANLETSSHRRLYSRQGSPDSISADLCTWRARVAKKMEAASQVPHPFVPTDLSLPGYVPLVLSQLAILSVYGISSLLVVSIIWLISGSSTKKSTIDRMLMCWWAFTGLTHMILEGYFVFSPEFYKNPSGFYLAEVWKEYSKGDSRYAARDSAVIAVEGLTAVLEGPACILAVYAIATKKSCSYILQFAISLGQLYGTAVYFITALLEGDNFAASPYYYYAYFVVANSFWVVIPTLISIRCWKRICAAVHAQGQNQMKAKTR